MSETDQRQEALEYLETNEPTSRVITPGFDRRAFLRRTALTGAAAGSVGAILSACGSSASSGGSSSVFGSHPIVQIRVRQPRHDQPVLRPHPVRDPGRVQPARLLLPVDRLGKQQRPPDGQRDEHRDHQRRRRDRGRADRPARLQRARPKKRSRRASRWSPTTPTRPLNKRLSYIGQELKLAGELMGARIVKTVGSGDVALFIETPGLGQPSAAHRRRRKGDPAPRVRRSRSTPWRPAPPAKKP